MTIPLVLALIAGAAAGFELTGDVVFKTPPKGNTSIVTESDVYWLRYDESSNAFNFFVRLDKSWEPRLTLAMSVATGKTYRVSCGWSGTELQLAVDGKRVKARRTGCLPLKPGKVSIGNPNAVEFKEVSFKNDRRPVVVIRNLRSKEFLPQIGQTVTFLGEVVNCSSAIGDLEVVAKPSIGTLVGEDTIRFKNVKPGETRTLTWHVKSGSKAAVKLEVEARVEGKVIQKEQKVIYLMPETLPDRSSKAWQPPISERRAYYIDSQGGDDAANGNSPMNAWRSFRNLQGLVLGPGERLLLRRGSVFDEELCVGAAGNADNWAEIGAYGEGTRPTIRRNGDIEDRCAFIEDAHHLVVRDLIITRAGSGLIVFAGNRKVEEILIERCLAHHIEGLYRFNSHGIPEWRDRPVKSSRVTRSVGIAVMGSSVSKVVLRDCESYQCSSGFCIRDVDTFVSRYFCHDNYAANTSPHPYNTTCRSIMTDCIFDASGYQAGAGTMGIMLWNNNAFIIRNCHFLNQPDSGSPDQGAIDFEALGDNILVDRCTFRNNSGAPIEVLGLQTPQPQTTRITRCRFDRNNFARKHGPAEISVWGLPDTPADIVCSHGEIFDNGYVLLPGVSFYHNEGPSTNDWRLANNRKFDFREELDAAYPWGDPPEIKVCDEIWSDQREVALSASVVFHPEDQKARCTAEWEQLEGPNGIGFERGPGVNAKARLPGEGDYRVQLKADDGTLWRSERTAIHVLPKGWMTYKAWNFSRNLDSEGWRAEDTGTEYEFLSGKSSFWNSKSFPVRLVCGDFYVIAIKNSRDAGIVTPDTQELGIDFSSRRINCLRIKMQNHTDSRRMRLWWQTAGRNPQWTTGCSVAFDVKPRDNEDTLYTVKLPSVGGIKQLRLSFSADREPITGTCRIDYIWLGHGQ